MLGHIGFGADHVGVGVRIGIRVNVRVASFSVYYLLDQSMDFFFCTDTLLGGERVNKIKMTLTLFSRSQWYLAMSKLGFRTLSLEPNNGFWPNYCFLKKMLHDKDLI